MKTLGLIGGISWVSTIDYYRYINEGVRNHPHSPGYARCIIHSFNYEDIKRNNANNDWKSTLDMITEAGINLKRSGAEGLVLCANTMHHIADEVEAAVQLPLIHIASATARAIAAQGISKVALLGTRFTMELPFFIEKLRLHGIGAITPVLQDREFIHRTIGEELGDGVVKDETRARYVQIIEALAADGAKGAILGCTEIPMLIRASDVSVPVFDTTRIHAEAAVAFAMGDMK